MIWQRDIQRRSIKKAFFDKHSAASYFHDLSSCLRPLDRPTLFCRVSKPLIFRALSPCGYRQLPTPLLLFLGGNVNCGGSPTYFGTSPLANSSGRDATTQKSVGEQLVRRRSMSSYAGNRSGRMGAKSVIQNDLDCWFVLNFGSPV